MRQVEKAGGDAGSGKREVDERGAREEVTGDVRLDEVLERLRAKVEATAREREQEERAVPGPLDHLQATADRLCGPSALLSHPRRESLDLASVGVSRLARFFEQTHETQPSQRVPDKSPTCTRSCGAMRPAPVGDATSASPPPRSGAC